MRVSALAPRAFLVFVVVTGCGVFAETARTAASRVGSTRAQCAKLKVSAKPAVNSSMRPETIKSSVTNCSSAKETVKLVQTIGGPTDARARTAKVWKITLGPGKTVVKTRSFPYACCGSYTVTDKVLSHSGKKLAEASANFTFA